MNSVRQMHPTDKSAVGGWGERCHRVELRGGDGVLLSPREDRESQEVGSRHSEAGTEWAVVSLALSHNRGT